MKRNKSMLPIVVVLLGLVFVSQWAYAVDPTGSAKLLVEFPGLSSVHTEVKKSDGIEGTVSDIVIAHSNWKSNKTTLKIPHGIYDVTVKKGEFVYILDDIDCMSDNCKLTNIVAQLTVNFPGLSSVHTDVWVSNREVGTIGDARSTKKNWKKNSVVIPVLKGVYDVRIRKESSTVIVDDVNCLQARCEVSQIVSMMEVNFPGLSSVHTDVWLPGAIIGNEGVERVTKSHWKKNGTKIPVLRGSYDVIVRKGSSQIRIDNVDCKNTICRVTDIVSTLTVNFPDLSSVHTDIWLPGTIIGEEGVERVTKSHWKKNLTDITVLRGSYDVIVRKGSSQIRINDVDCKNGLCSVTDIVSTLAVDFPGLSAVHTDVWLPGANIGEEGVKRVTKSHWKKNNTSITVLRGFYDVNVRKGPSQFRMNDVDCSNGNCNVSDIVSTLTVNFPGMSSVHTDVWLPGDLLIDSAERVTKNNWKRDLAEITVLKGIYDVRIRKKESAYIVNNIDCQLNVCEIKDIVATLSVRFPGLTNVHSDARIPDGIKGSATGSEVTKSNWKKQQTTMVVFKSIYDVRVRHATTSIFDDVDCSSGNCDVEVLGNVQITLLNGDNNQVLPNVKLKSYEKLADGTLLESQRGTTNNEGRANFTMPGVGNGRVYVVKAYRPFDKHKNFYSPFINGEGPLIFAVTADGDTELDLIPPTVSITTPVDGSVVSSNGFTVTGFANDNLTLDSVMLNVSDGTTSTDVPAILDASDNSWRAFVTADLLMVDQTMVLTATAADRVRNLASTSSTVTPIVDTQGPVINIVSHQALDEVPVTGFLLSGNVTDQTGVTNLVATLVDPVLNTVFENIPIEFSSSSGNWTVAVQNGQISEGALVNLSLMASDGDNNSSSVAIDLNVVAVDNTSTHIVNRITFGATPLLLSQLDQIGTQAFLDQQLLPASIDDTEFDARIAGMSPNSLEDLKAWTLMHMIYSKKQLNEVMTWFWDNHFNTDINSERRNANGATVSDTVAFELRENQDFRANALGNFRQLLDISAKSPAMLIFLDSISNVVNDANENYARELLELHSMGVDGGYSHLDIEAGAEFFTGWHLQNGEFFFNAAVHNSDPQTVFGTLIPAGGVEQGEQYLDLIAAHPSTANFICSKLVTLFVSDTPAQTLIDRCATLFQSTVNSPNQISQVLSLIMASPEFYDPSNDRGKIKTPVEFVVTTMRSLDAQTNAMDIYVPIEDMGIMLYENPIPTGWSEIGNDWVNPSLLIERIKWVNRVIRSSDNGDTNINLSSFFRTNGYETTEGIVGFLLTLTLGNTYPDLARQQAIDLLNGINGFDMNDPDAENRLQQVTGAVLSYPQYQFQ